MGAQGTVDKPLHTAGAYPPVAMSFALNLFHHILPATYCLEVVDTRYLPPAGANTVKTVSIGCRINGMHRGDPVGSKVFHGRNQCTVNLLSRLLRDFHGDEIHGIVLEDTGRFAADVFPNRSSSYVLHLAVNACKLHGQGVGQRHVTIEPRDKDRVVTGDGVNP